MRGLRTPGILSACRMVGVTDPPSRRVGLPALSRFPQCTRTLSSSSSSVEAVLNGPVQLYTHLWRFVTMSSGVFRGQILRNASRGLPSRSKANAKGTLRRQVEQQGLYRSGGAFFARADLGPTLHGNHTYMTHVVLVLYLARETLTGNHGKGGLQGDLDPSASEQKPRPDRRTEQGIQGIRGNW
jgi:hypothetical protein